MKEKTDCNLIIYNLSKVCNILKQNYFVILSFINEYSATVTSQVVVNNVTHSQTGKRKNYFHGKMKENQSAVFSMKTRYYLKQVYSINARFVSVCTLF